MTRRGAAPAKPRQAHACSSRAIREKSTQTAQKRWTPQTERIPATHRKPDHLRVPLLQIAHAAQLLPGRPRLRRALLLAHVLDVRIRDCKVRVTRNAAAQARPRGVQIERDVQLAWLRLLERMRTAVVDHYLRRRCDGRIERVDYLSTCHDTDGQRRCRPIRRTLECERECAARGCAVNAIFTRASAACARTCSASCSWPMVALDTWMLMIGHAGRYGVAGFNVAHFAWLDALAPLPSAGFVRRRCCSRPGCSRSASRCSGRTPGRRALLFLLYTYSWSMSMLDSYQHHYFVSLILLCMVFFPRLHSRELLPPSGGKRDAIYLAVCALALVVYAVFASRGSRGLVFFVAFAGLAGATLLHLRRSPQRQAETQLVSGFGYNLLGCSVCRPVHVHEHRQDGPAVVPGLHDAGASPPPPKPSRRWQTPALALGISNERFWALLSTSVIPVELAIAVGYALAILQDESPSRALKWAVHASFWLALSLHVGAEALGLEIGWFSYYMILLACTYLLPGRAIESLSQMVTRPAKFMASQLAEPVAGSEVDRTLETWLVVAAVGAVLFATSFLIDLPGARPTALLASLSLFVLTLYSLFRERTAVMRRVALGVGCAAALMWAAIAVSDVRWDFYRYLAEICTAAESSSRRSTRTSRASATRQREARAKTRSKSCASACSNDHSRVREIDPAHHVEADAGGEHHSPRLEVHAGPHADAQEPKRFAHEPHR